MRSMISAFVCIVALGCGTLLAHLGPATFVVALGLALALTLAAWLRRALEPDSSEARVLVVVGLLTCAGLVRGASAVEAPSPRQLDRGASHASLRIFDVVGASEPGPRCTLHLREPGARLESAEITVSAPIEDCPRSSGERVAVLTRALRPRWRADERAEAALDLGRGPVMWRRPAPARGPVLQAIDGYWRWVAARRQHAWEISRTDDASSLVVAAGLGLRSALAPARRDELRAAGLGHLIAVSGLHVAIAALWLQALARRLAGLVGLSPGRACVIAWLPLWAYVGLTGGAASAIRAAAMLTAVDLGLVVGRPSHGPTVLALVAAAMLLWEPGWLSDPGFALSIAAMAAIVTSPREQDPDATAPGVMAMSWRITWATAPLSVLFFDAAPLHGLVSNALALPLFGLMMPPALLASVSSGPAGMLALELARVFATPILDLAALSSRLPAAGPLALLGLASALLLIHLWRLCRRQAERRSAWLPPALACLLAAAVSLGLVITDRRDHHRAVPDIEWLALGTPRSRSLLVADHATPGSACLYRPTGSTRTWRWIFDHHDIHTLGRLDAALPPPDDMGPPRSDPRTRALAHSLSRTNIELTTGADCRPPPPERVREALRACQFMHGGRGPALARVRSDVLECRVEQRWVSP